MGQIIGKITGANNWQLRNACICVWALAKLMSAAQLFSFAAA